MRDSLARPRSAGSAAASPSPASPATSRASRSIARVAVAHDRQVALVGRSLWRIAEAARENGYLTGLPPFITEHDVGYLPREKVLLICTGSQGEPRSALARIAREEHPNVALEQGDAVVFSSRIIPGNEQSIGELQNELVKLGVEVVTERDHFVHVSGHPARDELVAHVSVGAAADRHPGPWRGAPSGAPMRGWRESCQVSQALVIENGDVVRLAPGPAAVVDQVPTGRLGLDGKVLIPLDGTVMRTRHRAVWSGAAVATLVLDKAGKLKRRSAGDGAGPARSRAATPSISTMSPPPCARR